MPDKEAMRNINRAMQHLESMLRDANSENDRLKHEVVPTLERDLKNATDRIGELQNELDDTQSEGAYLASQVKDLLDVKESIAKDKKPMVEIERITKSTMHLRTRAADGTIDGRKFTVSNNALGGDLIVEFEKTPDEPKGEIPKDRFIVKTRSVIESIWNHIAGEKQ